MSPAPYDLVRKLTDLGVPQAKAEQLLSDLKVNTLEILYDTDINEQTADECHYWIDGKGPTITLAINGEVWTFASFSFFCSALTIFIFILHLSSLISQTLKKVHWRGRRLFELAS